MVITASLLLYRGLRPHNLQYRQYGNVDRKHRLMTASFFRATMCCTWSISLTDFLYSSKCSTSYRSYLMRGNNSRYHYFPVFGKAGGIPDVKVASMPLTRSYLAFRNHTLQCNPSIIWLTSGVFVIIFSLWGVDPLIRLGRNLLFLMNDNSWKKSDVYYVFSSYILPLLLWTGAILICRALDPFSLPTEACQIVKKRVLDFIRSLATVITFAYCLSSMIQQAQNFFLKSNELSDTRNMGFHFAGKVIYSAVWMAAIALFMELLGFSTQKWLTAGGLGTVLLTLAGREIFRNFLSSAMIHATRPFIVNEWIQTSIEGYEVSGIVEHVGWWSPTIVRAEDREAVHIPNHQFTVNVVRNLSHKTHWRIKTHIAICQSDVSKINSIVSDMRKVLGNNPQVEQQRLHRRVFLDYIDTENQALLILVSCFVKTSRQEEYYRVKEVILVDLLRVISYHGARLATPIRTVQKTYCEGDVESISFEDSFYNWEAAAKRPLLLIGPSSKIDGDKTKQHTKSSARSSHDAKPSLGTAGDSVAKETSIST